MADLQEFVEDVITRKINYCAVCFRTEKERKLVPPIALSKFIKYIALEQLSETEHACIYCERQAEMAVKLHDKLLFARHVSRVLWSLINKDTMTPKSIAYLLPSRIRGQSSGPGSVKRNKLLSSMREYQTYLQTDILMIELQPQDVHISENTNNDVLVIDDDEVDNSKNDTPRLIPIEKLLQPQINIDQPNTINGNIVLYPMNTTENTDNQCIIIPNGAKESVPVLLPNGTIILAMNDPIENANLIANNNVATANTVNNVNNINLPDTRTVDNLINNVLTKAVINMPNHGKPIDGTYKTADIVSEAIDDGLNNNCMFQRRSKNSKKALDNFGIKRPDMIRKNGSDNMCQITDLRSIQEDEVCQKQAEPKKNHTIDWEDKIPMDVISFMNASDPNAPNLNKTNPIKTSTHASFTHPPNTFKTPVPMTPVIHTSADTQSYPHRSRILTQNSPPNTTITNSPNMPITPVHSNTNLLQQITPVMSKVVTTKTPSMKTIEIPAIPNRRNPAEASNNDMLIYSVDTGGTRKRRKKADDDVIIIS